MADPRSTTTPVRKKTKSRTRTRLMFRDIPGRPDHRECIECSKIVSRNLDTLRRHIKSDHPDKVTTPPKPPTLTSGKRKRAFSANPVPYECYDVDSDEEVPVWTTDDTKEAHTLLAQAMLECALPFAIVEHPAIVALFRKHNPSYTLPCTKTLSSTYLDTVFDTTESRVKKQLTNTQVALSVDESSDGAGDPIAHVVAIPPSGVPFLLEEIPHYTEQHTAENLLENISECSEKLAQLKTTVTGLINDNENKSLLLRQKFHEKFANTIVYTPGDPPHAAQKVFQDIVESDEFKAVNSNATFVADKFKNTRLKQFLKQELDIENFRWSSNMPVITRWGTHLKMYQTLEKYREEMESVLRNDLAKPYIHADLSTIIFNGQFWIDLTKLISTVKPIANAITNLEGDSCISNVHKTWKELQDFYSPTNPSSSISETTKRFVLAKLNERWNLIQDPIHTTSYLLDPRFRHLPCGKQFQTNGIKAIVNMVEDSKKEAIRVDLSKFRRCEFPFEEKAELTENPILFWQELSTTDEGKALAAIALSLLQFPQSSAAVERSFSALRRVHTWQRASLGREKLAKMIYVYVNCASLRRANKL